MGDNCQVRINTFCNFFRKFDIQLIFILFFHGPKIAKAFPLQEGFIKVFKNLHQFSGSGELGAWIRRIMVNSAINYLKKESRYQYDLSFSEKTLHAVSDENPEIILNAKELADLIRQLPTGYQTIFNMRAVEGYSHGEIGNILGIHEGTSKSQFARARALLISWITKNSLDQKTGIYARK